MNKKANLLTIGDISKYSGASIRSLRYYEQMKIMMPAYVDPDTGYRYYSADQLYHVGIIMFCIELGIPLKELAKLTDKNDTINLRNILEQGKSLAENKLKSLKSGLKLFEIIERQMDLSEIYPKGQIYPRKIEEKAFYVQPCDKSRMNQLDVIKAYMEMPFAADGIEGLMEYGFMYEHSLSGVEYFVFVEIPQNMDVENKKIIPAGIYFCCINEAGQIDNAPDIFKEQLNGKDSFIAIETEIMADKYEMGKPFFSELRVIAV
ncbi:MAG: MerR family transcriptional regulator [Defluviitaleaceae bacterium]|nr:MerR family transcriptional regulator [Defluviitaleaceae bacterium]